MAKKSKKKHKGSIVRKCEDCKHGWKNLSFKRRNKCSTCLLTSKNNFEPAKKPRKVRITGVEGLLICYGDYCVDKR